MIRSVTGADASDVVALLGQLHPGAVIDAARVKAQIEAMSASPHVAVLGYVAGERIIGMATLGRIEGLSHGCRPFGVIETVVVDASERSRGVGTALMRAAIELAETWGCYKVILETGSRRESTLRFYEGCGMTRGEKTAFILRLP
ncbi:MAG: GNAT family N-acetyltransferase [Planctomycetota bacterium]